MWSGRLDIGDVIGLGVQTVAVFGCGLEVDAGSPPGMIGQSYAARMLFRTLSQAVPKEATVLLLGETGVGKTGWARVLHELSGRKGGFVELNCANFTAELLESELFGHERGAYTGAVGRPGFVGAAEGGTLFLDEIGEMPPAIQAKLLTFLDTKTYRSVGGRRSHVADVRLISATNRELDNPYRRRGFRDDLYSRIAQPPVRIPSLAERREDIPLLVAHRLRQRPEISFPSRWMTAEVLEAMMIRPWYFNVRELLTFVDRIKQIPADAERDDVRFLVEMVAQHVDSESRTPATRETRSTPAKVSPQTPRPWRAEADGLDSFEALVAAVRELQANQGRPVAGGQLAPVIERILEDTENACAPRLSMDDSIRIGLDMRDQSGRVTQSEVSARLRVGSRRAQIILGEMETRGLIIRGGTGNTIYYVRAKPV